MALDPSIALGVKPLEIANPLAQYGQVAQLQHYQQQNALAQRAMAQEDALNQAYGRSIGANGQIDPNMLRQNVIGANLGSKLPAVEKTLLETGKLRNEVTKGDLENELAQTNASVGQIANYRTRADALTHIQQDMAAGKITPQKGQQFISMLPADDAGMPKFQADALHTLLTAAQKLEQHLTPQDTGAGGQIIATSKYAGGGPAQVVPGSQFTKTMTPGERAADVRAREAAAKPVWNEAGQGWVTAPTKAAPGGGFVPVPEVQVSKDQRGAIKALKTAGYDVETGTDEISKLIEKSTGGVMQQAGSAVLGSANITTSGREAIGRLKTRANQIGLDILGGKLGVGISNDDRKFIVEGLGNVADASIPSGERMAAWDEVKKRMVSSGMLPAPTKAPAAAGADGVDAANPLLK